MLKSVTFALLVAVVAAQRPGLGETLFGPAQPELQSQDEVQEMARQVVEGDVSEVCDNEEEFYKWYPPLPCRVENTTFDTLAERMCPEDGQCNVGPVDTLLNTTSVRIFFCSRPGKYMLYQACRVRNVETGEEREASQCASYDGRQVGCTVGPFAVLSNYTDYMVYYCDTTMTDSLKEIAARGVVSQACRIENEFGDDLVRRVCPHGFRCTKGPQESRLNDRNVQAYLCEEYEDKNSILENWDHTLSETVHYLVVEKEMDPFMILMVLRNLTDHGVEVSGKLLLHKVHEAYEAKAAMGGQEQDREGGEEQNDKENPMKIMHDLHHLSLMSMQAKVHEMIEEKGEEKDAESLAMMLKMMQGQREEEDDDEKDLGDLIKALMGKKQEKDEDKDLKDLIKALMGKKQEEEEDKDMTDLVKALMGMKQEKKMSKADQVKSVFKKIAFVKALGKKVDEIERSSGDDEAKLMKLMQAVHGLLEENENIMEGVSGPKKVMKVMKAVHYVKNKFEGAMEEQDVDVQWMLVIAEKLMKQAEEQQDDDEKDLMKLMMLLQGQKEEVSKEDQMKKFFKRMAFVKKVAEKVDKIERMGGDDEEKLGKLLLAVHEIVEENEDIMEGQDNLKKVMKVMKAVKYVKNKFQGAEEEQDEDVQWMVLAAKKMMEQAEMEEESEEAQLKMYFKKVAFVKAVGEKAMDIYERPGDEDTKLKKLLEAVYKMVEEHGDIIRGENNMAKVLKVMKALEYVDKDFRGAEEEEDGEIRWMVAIAQKLMQKAEEEEAEKNPLMILMKMLKGKKEEQDDEKNPLKMLMKMLQGKREEDDDEKNPLMILMKMLQGKREEDDDEKNPLMILMKMLQGKRDDEEDDEKNPLKMLMKMMQMREGDDDDEKEGMLKEILSALKEMSEKNQEADREGMQVLAFVRALMGGEGGENLQEVMHHLHHLHLLKAEKEMKEKYAEKSQQQEAENRAQELLQYMHQTFMQRQQMGGYGMPPMGGRW